jgi:hypothetical protein
MPRGSARSALRFDAFPASRRSNRAPRPIALTPGVTRYRLNAWKGKC